MEFAIVLPVFLLLLVAAVDVGRVFFTYIDANNAAREGAAYGAANPALTSGIQTAVFQEANVQSQAGQSPQSGIRVTAVCHDASGNLLGSCSAAPGGSGTGNTITVTVSEPFTFYTPLANNLLPNLTLSASATAAVVGLAPGGGGTPPTQCAQTPTASFTVSASGMTASVDASASAPTTGNCAIATYEWNFGVVSDCSVTGAPGCDLVGVTQSYTYTSASTYIITLTVQNPNGTATATQTVTVPKAITCTVKPTAGFKYVKNPDGSYTFTDGSTTPDPVNCPITSWAWSFSGGTPLSSNVQAPPSVTWGNNGNHTVSLTVTNAAGPNTYTNSKVK